MDIEKIDLWLGAVQKVAVIIGLIVSAWLFLIKEETSPHLKMSSSSTVFADCILRVDVQAENIGGRAWAIENASLNVFEPDFARDPDPADLKQLKLGTQIVKIGQNLREGEVTSFGFNLKLPQAKDYPFVVVKVAMKIKEEGQQWLRLAEESVPVNKCE